MSEQDKLDAALSQLAESRSARRRAGARTLRKLALARAGPALLGALESEVDNPRTWETQYQMVMALGTCGYCDALPFLRGLASRELDATMVYVALGDAIVRLSGDDVRASAALELLGGANLMLAQGALRAVAMLRMTPPSETVEQMIDFALEVDGDEDARGVWLWLAAAAAGWSGPRIEDFLARCAARGDAELTRVGSAALQGKYLKFNPL